MALMELTQEADMAFNSGTNENILEQLAHTEQLVAQLKDVIREKDAQLQQKDVILEEERKAADMKMTRLKLQAKARITSLNKRMEQMKAQEGMRSSQEPQSEKPQFHDMCDASPKGDQMEGFEMLKEKLQEKEELISSLQIELSQMQAEKAAQFDSPPKEEQMEGFEMLKQKLQEKEELINSLQIQLSQMQAENAAQLSSMQEVVREKDARFESQVRLHEEELLQLVTQKEMETEMQQNLRTLQRKIEEQEEALLGRAQVIDLLQQELSAAEQKNQILSEQLQQLETEQNMLKTLLETERQESKSMIEKMEFEVAERKLCSYNQQEEIHCLFEQLEHAGQIRAELEFQWRALGKRHKIAGEEKDSQIFFLQESEKELQSACEALKIQNAKLLQDISHQAVQSAQTIQHLEDELQQKSKEINQSVVKPVLQKSDMASQTSPDENSQALKVDIEENIASLQKRVAELEEEKCTLLLSTVELEELKLENEKLHSQLTLLEAQHGSEMTSGEVTEQITIDEIAKLSTNKPTEESRQEDNLEIIVSQKHKLSVLLLEMKEAQEEIAFLKGQLQITKPNSNLISESCKQGEIKQAEGERMIHESTGQSFPLMQSEVCSPIVIDMEGLESSTPQNQSSTSPQISAVHIADTEVEMESAEDMGKDSLSVAQHLILSQQDELKRLEGQIVELESSLQKAEESYEKSLGEKAEEISKLAQLVEDFKKNEEKNKSTLSALCDERDQLLVQVKELCVIAELKAYIKQLEENLVEAEKQRISDCENKTIQESLLAEQIQSLSTESKSKDFKIENLQKELDEIHLQFSDQSSLVGNLKSELQKKESEIFHMEEHIKNTSNKMEELSQSLSQKELEIARIDELLLEKTRVIEALQQVTEEKDQQMTEISVRMSDKMVQLNEEKFSLGVEVKALREKLSALSIPEGRKEKDTEEKEEECSGLQYDQDNKVVSAPLIKNEELQTELNFLKKERDQMKRKLYTALSSRKELMKKVTQLEKELAEVKSEPKEKTSFCEGDGMAANQQDKDEGGNTEESLISQSPETEISLNQKITEKELELQNVKRNLEEKVAAEEQLQVLLKEMKQSLQDKLNVIDVLKAEITENQIVIQNLTTSNKDSGDGDSAVHIKQTVAISTGGTESGEHWKLDLEDRILNLEQEKEQLQKKLQEVLASHKVTLKKAQEKDRHHREQLKQQKDDYNLLQERFDEQSKENENIRDQLQKLEIRVREFADSGLIVDNSAQELVKPSQSLIGPSSKAKEQCSPQIPSESGWHPDQIEHSGGRNDLQEEGISVELFRAQLKELQIQKEELEFRVSSTINDLSQKSEEAIKLQEQMTKLLLEADGLKVAAHEAEAQVTSMKQELENSQMEIRELEHFRELQPELEELKRLINKKDEEVNVLHVQVREKDEVLVKVQKEGEEQGELIRALHAQLEMQAKEHEEKVKQLKTELSEIQQKPEEVEEEVKSKQQIQRKLQAALISRKEILKENKCLKEELSLSKSNIETLTKTLTDTESQVFAHCKEKDVLLDRLTGLQEEKERLIAEVDRSLLESQNLSSSCESLKLALEGLTEDKEKLVKEIESLKCTHVAENTEWQEKHKELQKEYEILLQSYENVSNEAERIQHVVETVRQEKQELYGKLKNTEAKRKDTEKQLQEAEQEIEEIKGKMRKFAKCKQQKILELEEENDRLRAEVNSTGIDSKEPAETLLSSCSVKEELEDTKLKYESLSKEFEQLMTEKNSLSEGIQILKQQLEETESKLRESIEDSKKHKIQIDSIEVAQQAVSVAVSVPVLVEVEEQVSLRTDASSEYSAPIPLEGNSIAVSANDSISSHVEINNYIQQIDQLAERIKELEEEKKMREEVDCSLEDKKNALLNQLEAKDGELKTLREEVTKINLLNEKIQDELVKVTKLKETVEVEKDDLEERLMNQLAELNGSIGNYQQDVTDAQMRNEFLESEIQNLKKCVSELKEEKQQVVKEKNRIETEIQKEYLEKLQSAQKGGQGSKTHTKELQELLKEKQQEVRQLQKDCIRYQEKISGLEKTVKALEFVQNESQKELEMVKENRAQVEEDRKKAQAELDYCKVLLDDTQSEAARVLADSLKVKKELQSNKELVKSQMKQKDEYLERKLEQAEDKHMKGVKNMQEKLDALQREKAHLEETFGEVQIALNKKDEEVNQLQENLNSTLAQLAAFTKSMSSLQDDRDRVIEEAKKWERKFSDAIQTKEDEIRAKEENCSILKDHLRQMSIHMEELQINISRLEHDKQTWESKAQTEVQFQQKVSEDLQGENEGLMLQLEESKQMYSNAQNELAKLDAEVKSLRDQLTQANNSFTICKEAKEKLEGIVKQQEIDLRNYKLSCEYLEADLQASKDLTSKLHEEISTKDQKIITLLSTKEEAVLLAISELQQQHSKEVKELESQLVQKEEEKTALEDEKKKAVDKTSQLMEIMKTIKKDSKQQKAQLDSFTKSMSSLQDDRDRILENYRQLEEQHCSVILKKDQHIQEAAAENNKLKEEIRCFQGQMDDLNSENARLTAEQCQRVAKDCEQRQLLELRLQRNQELENEKIKLERKLRAAEASREDLKRSSDALEKEKQVLTEEIESLQASVSQLKCQVTTLQEAGSLEDLQTQLKGGEEEVQRLGITLSLSQKKVAELEEELVRVQKEAAKKVGEIEEKLKKELKHLRHDAGIMRNETETAEERVAELAGDLVEMEQRLLKVTEENKDLKAQIQAFGKSMSSLQDSRDYANEKLQELKKKHIASLEEQQCLEKEMTQLREELMLLNKEREDLVSKVASLESHSEDDSSLSHIEKLNQQLRSKDEELFHLSSQLEGSSSQIQSFSKAMASLQAERDHLLSEMNKMQKSEERKQWSSSQNLTSPSEIQSLKKAMSSLQNDRDRLLKELKNLQEQYLQINQENIELRPLKAQLQESQEQTNKHQFLQEQLKQENLSCQQELQHLRVEKKNWEIQEKRVREQYLVALSDKEQQLSHLQSLVQQLRSASHQPSILSEQYQRQAFSEEAASPESSRALDPEIRVLKAQLNDSLKEVHQKELRIQQLNSKLSQIFEEKCSLSIQLHGSSHRLRENHQRYNDLLNHCTALQRQIQEMHLLRQESGKLTTDTAPGGPQEKNEPKKESDTVDLKELQFRYSEAQQEQSNPQEEVSRLKKLLEEERDHRLAAEEALSVAQEETRRLELNEWLSVQNSGISNCGLQEQEKFLAPENSTFRRIRSNVGWRRILRSLCYSRTRVPLLAAIYILVLHILVLLCLTGHL